MKDDPALRTFIDTWYDDWFAMDRLYYEWARAQGISLTTLFCLYVIQSNPEYCTPGQIALRLARSKQTVNSSLDQMEAQGLILRKIDPSDRRNRLVQFTPEGREYASRILTQLNGLEQEAFSQLTEEERGQMNHVNERLAHLLSAALAKKMLPRDQA